jgi:hypothetical protein
VREPAQLSERSLQVLHVVAEWWKAADWALRAQGLHEDKVAAQLSASDKETGQVSEEIRGILEGLAAGGLLVYDEAEVGEGKVCAPTDKALALTEGSQSLFHRPPAPGEEPRRGLD